MTSNRAETARRLLVTMEANPSELKANLNKRAQPEEITFPEHKRQIAAAVSQAKTEERKRLSRELHDSVSQELYGIAVAAHTARSMLTRDPAAVADPLDYIHVLAEAALLELRAIIFTLRSDAIANEGLVVGITRQAASVRARHRIDVELELIEEPELGVDVKEAAFRIAQEALNNAVRHASAPHITVRLEAERDGVRLEVADSGVGFDVTAPRNGHLGLRSMEERAAAAGGQLQVASERGHGTRVCVWLPAERIQAPPHLDGCVAAS